MAGPVAAAVESKLRQAFAPTHLQVLNESTGHNVPPGSETHFKVVVVSAQFDGVKALERHRLVQAVLAHELQQGVHALSIKASTPEAWARASPVAPSPPCLGGSGR